MSTAANATSHITNTPVTKEPIYIRGFEVPSGAAYFLGGVTRNINKKGLGNSNLRTTVTFDGVDQAIPVELYTTELSKTTAGPGEIAGVDQFTVLFQYAEAAFVRATGYGRHAVQLRDKVMEAIGQKRAFSALAEKVANGEAEESELTNFPRRIVSFGLSGTNRPNISNQNRGQNGQQPQQQPIQYDSTRVRASMSMKLEELFVNYSDGTEEAIFTVGTGSSSAPEQNFL